MPCEPLEHARHARRQRVDVPRGQAHGRPQGAIAATTATSASPWAISLACGEGFSAPILVPALGRNPGAEASIAAPRGACVQRSRRGAPASRNPRWRPPAATRSVTRTESRMSRRFAALPGILLAIGLLAPAAAQAGEGAALTPSDGAVEFGSVDIHFGGSPRQSIQFTDKSASSVTVKSVSVQGSSAFQVVSDGCSSGTLSPEVGSCAVEVAFAPQADGAQSGTLELVDTEGTVEVPLSGEGITGTLTSQQNPLSFAAIPYTAAFREGQNETEQATIQDTGSAGTEVGEVSIQGPDASSFDVQYGNCEHALLHLGTPAAWEPSSSRPSPGPKHAQLVITSDSAAGPLIVPLEGEGLLGPKISMSSYQELLGNIELGDSVQRTFTLTNTGDYPLGVQQAFLVSGTPLMFPVLSDGCSGQIVRQGESCSITVAFTPGTVGEKDASLLIITSDPLPVTVIGMSGAGVPRPAPRRPRRRQRSPRNFRSGSRCRRRPAPMRRRPRGRSTRACSSAAPPASVCA